MKLELATPSRMLVSTDVDEVVAPGIEGYFGVLPGHAPLVATLRPGILTIYAGGSQRKMVVLGGFAEVSAGGLTVLADVASSIEELDRALLAERIAAMEAKCKEMEQGSALDREIRKLDHFKQVDHALQGTAMH